MKNMKNWLFRGAIVAFSAGIVFLLETKINSINSFHKGNAEPVVVTEASPTPNVLNGNPVTPSPEPEINLTATDFQAADNSKAESTDSFAEFKGIKIPPFCGEPSCEINGNTPLFAKEEIRADVEERYSPLDDLGRCGEAYANICIELMPTEEREAIGQIKPSGWHTVKYPGYVEGNYLYNRCHLIGFQLAGENANELNLITGTRYMNVQGQLPYESMVAEYVKKTGNHVMYRVTPIFEGIELVARGVVMEAFSVEDNGAGCSFCIFCYNIQPGIGIDYKTGDSSMITGYSGHYSKADF